MVGHTIIVSSVLCFCVDGTIPIAYINIPGAVHDSQIADYGDIYDKLETLSVIALFSTTISANCSRHHHSELNLKHFDPSYSSNHSHHVLLILHLLTLHLDLKTEFLASLLTFLSPFVPVLSLTHHHHCHHIPNSVARIILRRIFTLSIPGPQNRGIVCRSTASIIGRISRGRNIHCPSSSR
jgi:hypothetical protein